MTESWTPPPLEPIKPNSADPDSRHTVSLTRRPKADVIAYFEAEIEYHVDMANALRECLAIEKRRKE